MGARPASDGVPHDPPCQPHSPIVTAVTQCDPGGDPQPQVYQMGSGPSPTTLDVVAAPSQSPSQTVCLEGPSLSSPSLPCPLSPLPLSPFPCLFTVFSNTTTASITDQRTRLLALERHDRVNQASTCLWDAGQSDSWVFSGQLGWEGWGSLVTAPERSFTGKHTAPPQDEQGSTEGRGRRRDEAEPLLPRDPVARGCVSRTSPDKWGALPGLHKGAAAPTPVPPHPPLLPTLPLSSPTTANPPFAPLTPGLRVQFHSLQLVDLRQ